MWVDGVISVLLSSFLLCILLHCLLLRKSIKVSDLSVKLSYCVWNCSAKPERFVFMILTFVGT